MLGFAVNMGDLKHVIRTPLRQGFLDLGLVLSFRSHGNG